MVDLSIIIVSWNVKDLLKKCLASIYKNQANLSSEVFVIDNASNDGTPEMIKNNFPQVKLIVNKKNLGFAAANIQGIKQGQGNYFLILNPDTEILDNTLEKMVSFMETNNKIGIASCRHLNSDKTLQKSVRRLPRLLPILLILTKLAKIMPDLSVLKNYFASDFDYGKTQPAEQVAGSFFLIRRKTIDEIGLFDPKFFLWFEEVDFCKRALAANWQVWYYAQGQIIHHGGQSFAQHLTWKKQLIFFKSAWYYFKKHGFIW